jgi:hypothetical protein
VEVVDGPRAGDSVLTDSTGSYVLTGPFTATDTIRATEEGYVAGIRTFGSSAGPFQNENYISFSLNVPAPPVNIAGVYTLTVVADEACAQLPTEARTRVFTATITLLPSSIFVPDNTSFHVALSGSDFANSQGNMSVGVSGNDLGIWVSDPAVAERIAPNVYVAIEGEARATISAPASSFPAVFDGRIEFCESSTAGSGYYSCDPGPGVRKTICDSKTHRMMFSRH